MRLAALSPASRGRGLKLLATGQAALHAAIARITRARIETLSRPGADTAAAIARITRARIETGKTQIGGDGTGIARITRARIETLRAPIIRQLLGDRPHHAGAD